LAVVNVRTEVPEPVTDAGAKDAVTPAGIPLAVRLTAPLNPFNEEIVRVLTTEPPAIAFTDAGYADRVKLGAALTTRLNGAVCDRVAPLAPVIVMA
jgi:hypothetical protein